MKELENADHNRQPQRAEGGYASDHEEVKACVHWERYIAVPAILILIGWLIWARLLGH